MVKRRTENKMGKRILAGICCIGLLTAAGCSQNQEEPDPQELYQAAVEKNGELTDLDMTMGTKMTLEQAGETVDIDMNVDMLMSGYNTSDLQYQMETTTSLLGQNIEMTAFYTDGYYYMETSGQKLKYPYDLEAITEQVENSMGGTVSSEAMTELTAEKEGENTRLTFTGDPEKMTNYTKEILSNMQTGTETADFTIEKAGGSYLINPDGYYIESNVDMDLLMNISGSEVSVNTKMTSTLKDPGKRWKSHCRKTCPPTQKYRRIFWDKKSERRAWKTAKLQRNWNFLKKASIN